MEVYGTVYFSVDIGIIISVGREGREGYAESGEGDRVAGYLVF